MVKVGAEIALLTVTVTIAVVACRLFESVATAFMLCVPFATDVESHMIEYGDDPVMGEPKFSPSTLNCTEEIVAGLVADAVAAKGTDEPDTGATPDGAVIKTVGGVPPDAA